MSELAQRVGIALGPGYRIERELGGGGMSHVFLATELSLDRRVVVKVLPPELAVSVNAERFAREVRLVASLQHPAIVPLIASGGEGDLLWFTMPFVDGESLRERLSREGELPMGDAVRIWGEVLDALSYAHGRGVVHRDIKPDNVLLSGRHALVADFGVARAVSTATGAARVTSTGLALGTPAYMSPEQAAGDPATDHRADIYSAGLVMYEMLTGTSPYGDRTPQQQMAAHATMPAPPVRDRRQQVNPALEALVMQCLEKRPADRPQSADALLQQLHAIPDVSSGSRSAATATGVAATSDARTKKWSRGKVIAGVAGLLAIFVAAAGYFATKQIRWGSAAVLPDSAKLLVLLHPVASEAADSLLAQGIMRTMAARLANDQRLRIAPIDEMLPALAGFLGVRQDAIPRDTLRRWTSDLGGHASLSLTLARANGGFVLGAELRSLEPDSLLFTEQLPASSAEDLTRVAERIAANSHRAIGTVVGKLAAQQPTGAFFNTSADAARLMVEGGRAFADRNFFVAAERYRDAVRIDSTFAMAWEMLAFSLGNAGVNVDERLRARAASFRHRDKIRLLNERLGIEAEYYRSIGDNARAMAVFERLEREYGSSFGRTNGLGLVYAQARRFDDARRAFDRVRDSAGENPNFANQNYVMSLVDLGRLDDARREVQRLDSVLGFDHPTTRTARYHVLIAERDLDSVTVLARRQLKSAQSPAARVAASNVLRDALMARGELAAADKVVRDRGEEVGRSGALGTRLSNDLLHVFKWMHLTDDTVTSVKVLDDALARTPLSSLAPMDRPYANAIRAFGAVGRFDAARALAVEWSAEVPDEFKPAYAASIQNALGEMELRANRPREAVEHFQRSDAGSCVACYYPDYARSWDAIGNADSALYWYERFINVKSARLLENDALFLAQALRRAAELHEAKGDVATATQRYASFVSLWKNADASLQPFVASTKAKLERLRATRR